MTQISQDELLARIDTLNYLGRVGYVSSVWNALRGVITRHKLKIDMNGYGACEECSRTAYFNVPWPCETIKDIARELND